MYTHHVTYDSKDKYTFESQNAGWDQGFSWQWILRLEDGDVEV